MRLSIFTLLFICCQVLSGQVIFRAGLAGGMGHAGELNRIIHTYNATNDLDKEMGLLRTFTGIGLSLTWESDLIDLRPGMELRLQNKYKNVSSEWTENNITYRKEFRFRMNQISFGLYGHLNDECFVGIGADIGTFNGFHRTGKKDEIKHIEFEKSFVIPVQPLENLSQIQNSISFFMGYE